MSDLKNRIRKNITIDIKINEWLEKYSSDTHIPASRVIEIALIDYKKKGSKNE